MPEPGMEMKMGKMFSFGKFKVATTTVLFIIMMWPALSFTTALASQHEKPHIVMLISEDPDNYEAHQTIPPFAEMLQQAYDLRVTVIKGEGARERFHFPGLEVLSEADLLVVFCRRIALTGEQMNLIKNYLREGKPLVGIRTANHAFSVRSEVPEGYQDWWDFVPDILGCENRGYGDPVLGTDVSVVPEAADHPLLQGFEPAGWHSKGNVYLVAPLLDEEATVLLSGKAGEKVEPIAWTRQTADESRVFYTSLGYPEDFQLPQFRQLLINGIYWALDQQVP